MEIIHADQEVEMSSGRTVSRTMSLDDPEIEDMCLFTVMGVEMECDDDTTIDITTVRCLRVRVSCVCRMVRPTTRRWR